MRSVARLGARRAWIWRNRALFSEPRRSELPRLLVDVSAIIRHDARTGIQRVVRAIWSELSKRSGDGFVAQAIYASNEHGYCYAPADFLKVRPRRLGKEPVSMGEGDRFLALDLSAHLLPKYRQQLRAWRTNGATIHVVVYDLLPLKRPEWFTVAAATNFKRWFRVLRDEADQAICISGQVAEELREELEDVALPVVGRLHMGGDLSASRPSMGISTEIQKTLEAVRRRPAILMVGTVEPRKGYDVALGAFEHLWKTRPEHAPDLIIIGKPGWKTEDVQQRLREHPEYSRRLHWLDSVSDEALCKFYEGCRGVLMTSRGEGFGLPLIEAAAHRRFVLARDLAVFRAQRLPNVIYFNDDRPVALADEVMKLVASLDGPAPSADLLTWSDCVDRLLVELGVDEAVPDRSTGDCRDRRAVSLLMPF